MLDYLLPGLIIFGVLFGATAAAVGAKVWWLLRAHRWMKTASDAALTPEQKERVLWGADDRGPRADGRLTSPGAAGPDERCTP
jgi:hypothetical protein